MVVVNGYTEPALDTVTAAAEKAADPAERMEQRNAYGEEIEEIIAFFFEGTARVYDNRDISADKPAVIDHTAESFGDQRYEGFEGKDGYFAEDQYYIVEICDTVEQMSADEDTCNYRENEKYDVFKREFQFFPENRRTDHAGG